MGMDESNLVPDWRERLQMELSNKQIAATHLSADLGKHRDYVGNVLRGRVNPNISFFVSLFRQTGIDIFTAMPEKGENDNRRPTIFVDKATGFAEPAKIEAPRNVYPFAPNSPMTDTAIPTKVSEIGTGSLVSSAHQTLRQLGPAGYSIVTRLPSDPSVYSTYPKEWLEAYEAQGLGAVDPVHEFMQNRAGYTSWADLNSDDAADHYFKIARDFSLPNGSVLTSARRGCKIAVSLSHEQEALTPDERQSAERALNAFLVLMEPPKPRLEPFEVLYYLANGLNNAQLRKIYNVSARKITEVKNAAIKALNAKNLDHAIAIGTRVGII